LDPLIKRPAESFNYQRLSIQNAHNQPPQNQGVTGTLPNVSEALSGFPAGERKQTVFTRHAPLAVVVRALPALDLSVGDRW
jgi:hypothetical protein